jgi:hypothetical protein
MAPRIITLQEQPELSERLDFLDDVWPEYNKHGDVLNRYWGRLWTDFPQFQFVLYDETNDAVLGKGHTIPCTWDGTVEGLPAGIDAVMEEGMRLRERRPNALSALAAIVAPGHQGGGLSRVIIEGMATLAARHGFHSLIAPVRPSMKHLYPLTPIERYVGWTRDDGLPFDPWIRVHHRMNANLLRVAPHSLRITGSVADWEQWTGMAFPETGTYIVPEALAPVEIDCEEDLGRYWEPNVWMRHGVGV